MTIGRRRAQSKAQQAVELAELRQQLSSMEAALIDVDRATQGHGAWLADLQRWMTSTVETVASISSLPPTFSSGLARGSARLADPVEVLARQLRIWAVTTWLSQVEITDGPRVSVVTPTRNRRRLLERAVGTVLAQSYPNWELVVVDNASEDDTPEFLAGLQDARIRKLTASGKSAARARNVGLDAATGDLIAHFDDDNLMFRDWLKAVAWAFTRWTEADVLYGARIIEDARTGPAPGGAFPSIEFFPYDRDRLEVANFIDTNVIAHRAGLPEAHFDEGLSRFDDWDLCLRLTGYKDPLELPVVACSYMVGAPNRMSEDGHYQDQINRISSRVHTTRPMRLLIFTPTTREGIGELAGSLREEGAIVQMEASLDEARERLPDLVLLDAYDGAPEVFESLQELRLPFFVRGAEPVNHPFCLGSRSSIGGGFLKDLSAMLTEWRYANA
jgi:hypothetical protein